MRRALRAASSVPGQLDLQLPSVRRLALQHRIDVSSLSGSGPRGRLVKGDVLAALASGKFNSFPAPEPSPLPPSNADRKPAAAASAAGGAAGGDGGAAGAGGASAAAMTGGSVRRPGQGPAPYTSGRISTMRKTIAKRLTGSKRDAAHSYLTTTVDVSAVLEIRPTLPVKVSVNDFIIQAAARALRSVPAVNASADGRVDVAVAVATDTGLITPIVPTADRKGLAAISSSVRELAASARQGTLLPEQYQGGSLAISNLGMYGISRFSGIINPPHAAILTCGKSQAKPVLGEDGVPRVKQVCDITLCYDASRIDQGEAAQFLDVFRSTLQQPLL